MQLAQTLKDFEDGNWGSRATLNREDELGKLANIFNNMAARIEQSNRQEQEAILIEAKRKAESGEKAKAEFLATESHSQTIIYFIS